MKIKIFMLNRDHTCTTRKVYGSERLFKYAGGKYAMATPLIRTHSAEVEPMLVYCEGDAIPWGIKTKNKADITRFTWRKHTLEQLSGELPGFKLPQWVKSIFNIKVFPWIIIALYLIYHFLGGG